MLAEFALRYGTDTFPTGALGLKTAKTLTNSATIRPPISYSDTTVTSSRTRWFIRVSILRGV